ncbi:hypothetical protein KR026_004640, partial [Drosophila bipectinata]
LSSYDLTVYSFFVVASIVGVLYLAYRLIPRIRIWVAYFKKIIRICIAHFNKIYHGYCVITYMDDEKLSEVSKRRLEVVGKKTLVLDMDETLMTAVIQRCQRQKLPEFPYDHKLILQRHDACAIYVYKRPHVDYFLDCVSKWYDLVIFTASTGNYAGPILDYLDRGKGILRKRLFREDCIDVLGLKAKYVSLASPNLANVFLLDDSNVECRFNAGNAIKISSYVIGKRDQELINILPFLDCLRFTQDVRSVLGLCTRFECLTT